MSYLDQLYIYFLFFFNDTATTEIYTLSLHDALPISARHATLLHVPAHPLEQAMAGSDRKSTRLNSSHSSSSYAVFCLKKKNTFPDPERNAIRKSEEAFATPVGSHG